MQYAITTSTKKVASLTKKVRALQGGTSASKTISTLMYLIHLAQADKSPTLTSIISESTPHLKRGARRDFVNILQGHNYWRDSEWNATDSIYTFPSGSQIEFFSADQSEKLRGGRRDRGFMNEANNMTLEQFDEFEVRTREFVYLDWNPSVEFWYYTDVEPVRTDCERIILTYKDNEALDESTVNSIEQRQNRPSWWQVYGLGQLGETEERIYTGWNIIEEIPHQAKLVRFWVDFGYTNDPTSIGAVYEYNGGFILDELAYQKGLSNKQIADIILNQEATVLTIADSSEPKSIDEIKSYGVPIVGAEKGADSIRNGIQVVQDERFSITKRSVDTIKEYRNYVWERDKDGRILNVPSDIWNHSMDGIRYAITSLKHPKPMTVKVHQPTYRGFNRRG